MKNSLELARAFRQKNHFSDEAWLERGLNPSPAETNAKLNLLLNRTTDEFIVAIEVGENGDKYRAILSSGLNSFSESDFDSEEKEYFCELFYELGAMVNVNMSYELNSLMYGPALAEMLMKQSERKAVEILDFTCTQCGSPLRMHVMQKSDGIPAGWDIVTCNTCNTLNLLEFGEGVKEWRFDNYQSQKTLRASQYTREQAIDEFNRMQKN